MIWRLFRGRSTTKETTTSSDGETVDATAPRPEQTTVPSLNAFKFEATTKADPVSETDTAVEVPSAPDTLNDFATVVREKSRRRRGIRVAERGVTPILIPSLQETAVRLRAIATSVGGRKPTEAAEYWRAYLRLRPADAEAWFSHGRCLLVSGHEQDAESAFRRTVDVDPEHALGWAALGYIAERKESFDHAVTYYARAVEFDRENLEFLCQYMRLLDATGDAQTADVVREQIEEIRQGNRTGLR